MIHSLTVHEILVEATDEAGNTGVAIANITIDTAAPVVNISFPVAGTKIKDTTPLLSYTASEGTVVVRVDNGAPISKVSGDSLDILGNGLHTVRVEATDTAGNIGVKEVSFRIDTNLASYDSYVEADITTNTTWTLAGSPYIITNYIYVKSGSTLTIEPGVTVTEKRPRNGHLRQFRSSEGTGHGKCTDHIHVEK